MAESVADDKKYLRTILGESRSALSAEHAAALSAQVQARLIGSKVYQASSAVVLYAANGNEVATDLILLDSLSARRQVYYPRLDPARRSLSLAPIRDPGELKPGAFGIPEPPAQGAIAPGELEAALVCVPGLAFTTAGARLGRGGGYYDRLLAQAGPETSTAGLAYSFQVLDSLPENERDRRLHFVVTEFAVHMAAKSQSASRGRIARGGASKCLSC